MNKCDPFYCEGLTGGSHFLMSHFLGWWTARCGGLAGGGWGGWGEEVEGVVGFWSG